LCKTFYYTCIKIKSLKRHLREEKICLNCGSEVKDRYCPHCGQENIDPKENFGHLVNHFFSDLTHYDSNFFITIKDLLLRPGFLTKQYLAGKRMRYLNPIRMYIFISFVFFLTYFAIGSGLNVNVTQPAVAANVTRQHQADMLRAEIDSNKAHPQTNSALTDSILAVTASKLDTTANNKDEDIFDSNNGMYKSINEYDSIQQSLPARKRDNLIARFFIRHGIAAIGHYHGQLKEVMWEKFEHNIPKMMFLLLPIFALLLKLFYSWKKYYYVDHAIFSLHFHSFAFLIFWLTIVVEWIFPHLLITGWAFLLIFIYLLAALKNTYNQSWVKSFFKAFFICIIYSVTIGLALAIVGMFTFIFI
jgi:Protein of unknown function (DUF3667)